MASEEKPSEADPSEPQVETIGYLLLSHAESPRNMGLLETANGVAVGVGSCGDSLTVQLLAENGTISEIRCIPNGCLYTVVCASVMSEMAKGRKISEALMLQPEDVDSILGGLPSGHMHCARLAINTLGEAIDDYCRRHGFPDDDSPDDE